MPINFKEKTQENAPPSPIVMKLDIKGYPTDRILFLLKERIFLLSDRLYILE